MGVKLWITTFALFNIVASLAYSAERGHFFSYLPECKDYWSQLIPLNQHKYDYKTDAKVSSNGNFGYSKYAKRVQRTECRKDWVVLIYMAADNDLNPYALWDVYEMEAGFAGAANAAGSTLNVDILVQFDGKGRNGLRRHHIFATPETYSAKEKSDFEKLSEKNIRSPVVEVVNENIPESKKLEDFVLWARERYPAKHTAVIVWGHGQGWKTFAATDSGDQRGFGGIGFNQTSGGRIDIPSIRQILEKFRKLQKVPVDLYASDACLMQMVEVGSELANEARFIVGSTQVQNFLGLPYRRIFYELNTGRFNGERSRVKSSVDAKDEPYLFAKMIPNLMKQSMHPELGLQGRSDPEGIRTLTSSAITSHELLNQLLPSLEKLGIALKKYLSSNAFLAMDLQMLIKKVPEMDGSAQDLGVFLGMLSEWLAKQPAGSKENLQKAIQECKSSLDQAVLSYSYGSSYGIDESNGRVGYLPRAVSLWLPKSRDEYLARISEFKKSRFYRASQWSAWLEELWR